VKKMPFDPAQYQESLKIEDKYSMQQREEVEEDIRNIKEKLNNRRDRELEQELNDKKGDIDAIIILWKKIRYILYRFQLVDENADKETVWDEHEKIMTNCVAPLYESLEKEEPNRFIKRLGLIKKPAAAEEKFCHRIHFLVKRMSSDPENGEIGKEAVEIAHAAFKDWVSDVLANSDSKYLPKNWSDQKFQIYVAYEALYSFLLLDCAYEEIVFADLYKGIYDWLGSTNQGIKFPPKAFKWPDIIAKLDENYRSRAYLALFSKSVHLYLENTEEACTQDEEKRQEFINKLQVEITHLAPQKGVLDTIQQGMKDFKEYAQKASKNELGSSARGREQTRQPNCDKESYRFWGIDFCQHLCEKTQDVFPKPKAQKSYLMWEVIRDIFIKPLSDSPSQRKKVEHLLEGGRGNTQVDDILALTENATLPVFRDIWQNLDNEPIEEDDF
jgi:hypothetical protein